MVAALATDEQALIGAIVLARLLVPLLIPRFPLVILAALVLDAVDNSLLGAFTNVDLGPDGPYQSTDKALDIYYLAIAYVSTLRNWTNLAAIRVGQFLFYYRLVGVLAFELLESRAMLLLFPNTFEFFFILYAVVALRYDPARVSTRFWVLAAAGLWIFVKLPQEYWIHIAQLDFTDTVADHPWFGVASALFVLGLLAVLLFVVRPRLRAPDHDWRFAAEAHVQRLHGGALAWSELTEKAALLSLLCVIFATILPAVQASAFEVALGVLVIVAANAAISTIHTRLGVVAELGALLVANLGLIYLIGRFFFSEAENFPLKTALFFAFLITLMIWLYDLYKPVFDERFGS